MRKGEIWDLLRIRILGTGQSVFLPGNQQGSNLTSPLWSKEVEPESSDRCGGFTLSYVLKDINSCWSLPLKPWRKQALHLLLDSSLARSACCQKSNFFRWGNTNTCSLSSATGPSTLPWTLLKPPLVGTQQMSLLKPYKSSNRRSEDHLLLILLLKDTTQTENRKPQT